MAVILKLTDNSRAKTFDFTSGGIIRYITGTFTDIYDGTREDRTITFSTIAKGTETQIRDAYKDLELLLYRINIWINDKTISEAVFITLKHQGETERRTLIKEWTRKDVNDGTSDPMLDKAVMVISDWTFTRHYAWENINIGPLSKTNISVSCNTGGAMVGNTSDQTADHDGFEWDDTTDLLNDGTRQGRIKKTEVSIPQTTGGNNWDRIWIGMKPVFDTEPALATKWRAHTNFTDAFGMTKIDTNVDGAVAASDSLNSEVSEVDFTASPGTPWSPRLFNQIPHQFRQSARGSYLVLFRMKIQAATSTVARVGMFFSWGNFLIDQGKADHFEDIYVDDSNWHLYEMGVIQIPPEGMRFDNVVDLDLNSLNIGLNAERVAGTGSVFIDYATLIPQDHFLSVSNAHIGGSTGQFKLKVFTTDDDEIVGYGNRDSPDRHYPSEISSHNWTWPADRDKELLVVTAADGYFGDSEAHEYNKSFDTALTIIQRYYGYNPD